MKTNLFSFPNVLVLTLSVTLASVAIGHFSANARTEPTVTPDQPETTTTEYSLLTYGVDGEPPTHPANLFNSMADLQASMDKWGAAGWEFPNTYFCFEQSTSGPKHNGWRLRATGAGSTGQGIIAVRKTIHTGTNVIPWEKASPKKPSEGQKSLPYLEGDQ